MSYCVMCGLPVSSDQRTCSMCYGDIDHGEDGYYREYMEREFNQPEDDDEKV